MCWYSSAYLLCVELMAPCSDLLDLCGRDFVGAVRYTLAGVDDALSNLFPHGLWVHPHYLGELVHGEVFHRHHIQ